MQINRFTVGPFGENTYLLIEGDQALIIDPGFSHDSAAMFGLQVDGFSFDPQPLAVQPEWRLGNFVFEVRYTPGHSPDHLSLYHAEDEIMIAGDALFKEGIGRTDLYKGDFSMLEKSIREQLYSLPDDTVVYPGHGPETTIGHEKKSNPFVKL